jgi:hypothetical protein
MISILGILVLAAPAQAKSIPLKVSVTCKAVKKGASANITGFVATGQTPDLKKGAVMKGSVASVEFTKNGKVTGTVRKAVVTGKQEMTPNGPFYGFQFTGPGRRAVMVNVFPNGKTSVFVAGGENFSGDELPPYPTTCTSKR